MKRTYEQCREGEERIHHGGNAEAKTGSSLSTTPAKMRRTQFEACVRQEMSLMSCLVEKLGNVVLPTCRDMLSSLDAFDLHRQDEPLDLAYTLKLAGVRKQRQLYTARKMDLMKNMAKLEDQLKVTELTWKKYEDELKAELEEKKLLGQTSVYGANIGMPSMTTDACTNLSMKTGMSEFLSCGVIPALVRQDTFTTLPKNTSEAGMPSTTLFRRNWNGSTGTKRTRSSSSTITAETERSQMCLDSPIATRSEFQSREDLDDGCQSSSFSRRISQRMNGTPIPSILVPSDDESSDQSTARTSEDETGMSSLEDCMRRWD